jgi:hypothetical protein
MTPASQNSLYHASGSMAKRDRLPYLRVRSDQTAHGEPRKVAIPDAALIPAPVISNTLAFERTMSASRFKAEVDVRALRLAAGTAISYQSPWCLVMIRSERGVRMQAILLRPRKKR